MMILHGPADTQDHAKQVCLQAEVSPVLCCESEGRETLHRSTIRTVFFPASNNMAESLVSG